MQLALKSTLILLSYCNISYIGRRELW